MRELTVRENAPNLNGAKEFNHLRITNLNSFLEDYGNKYDYYKSPFAILAELEEKVKYENNPPESVDIAYKDFGFMIFDLKGVYEKNGDDRRFVEYAFVTSAS